jgi:hypothetical protein
VPRLTDPFAAGWSRVAPVRPKAITDPERHGGLGGRISGTRQGHQARRIDERQSAGLDHDGSRAGPEYFAESTPEPLGTGHVELTDKDDGGFGAVEFASTYRTSPAECPA